MILHQRDDVRDVVVEVACPVKSAVLCRGRQMSRLLSPATKSSYDIIWRVGDEMRTHQLIGKCIDIEKAPVQSRPATK
jgi:hypothetical protein